MNNVTLLGRLTKAPEVRYTNTNNKAVCSFTIAVNRRFKKDEADFINCQAWDKTAEFISKYFDKGSQIALNGRIQTRNWEDNEGKKHFATEIVVDEVYFAGSKAENKSEYVGNSDELKEPEEDDSLPF